MKENKGITLISLAITIILLLVLSTVIVSTSTESIERAKLEELRTNLLLIQAKAQEYVEEVNFKLGIKPTDEAQLEEYNNKKLSIREEIYEGKAKLKKADTSVSSDINITDNFYEVTQEALVEWNLDIETFDQNKYLVEFDDENSTLKVYNTRGYSGKYSLEEIEEIE